MIKLENIDVCFGDFKALKNINIHVKEGEFFTFLGPQGVGRQRRFVRLQDLSIRSMERSVSVGKTLPILLLRKEILEWYFKVMRCFRR